VKGEKVLGFFRVAGMAMMLPAALGAMQPQDRTAESRAKFAHQNDPIQKAKLLEQLGNAQFRQIQTEAGAGNLSVALEILREYHEEAQACEKALDGTGRDPEKHPNGYKQLQISVRESLRRLDDVLVGLSGEEQKPFLEIRNNLDEMNRQLIHELFPRRPENQPTPAPEPAKPKS
jgi:hypothetical protein